jgi:hypothetical protein
VFGTREILSELHLEPAKLSVQQGFARRSGEQKRADEVCERASFMSCVLGVKIGTSSYETTESFFSKPNCHFKFTFEPIDLHHIFRIHALVRGVNIEYWNTAVLYTHTLPVGQLVRDLDGS